MQKYFTTRAVSLSYAPPPHIGSARPAFSDRASFAVTWAGTLGHFFIDSEDCNDVG
jgi:hypothetical protein